MHLENHPIVQSEPLPGWKRMLDIACSLAALPFLVVVALWALVITNIVSRGPIFFRQERLGLLGRRFYLYKFRTMHVSACGGAHQRHFAHLVKSNTPMEKLDARTDQRLIPGGWLLRASGLDELPQIINVLRGEMSVVGPRPCIPYEYDEYSTAQRNRLGSVPGMTGLWQVSGKNRTTFDEMIRLDIAYAERKSFVFDVGIILRTVPALWRQMADTRKARQAVAGPNGTAEAAAAGKTAPGAGASNTFLTQSHDVVSAAGEQGGDAPRQFSSTYSMVENTVQPATAQGHVDSTKVRE